MNYLVCGAPGSGKTFYVNKNKKWGDIIVDFDTIACALSGETSHDFFSGLIPYVTEIKNYLIGKISTDNSAKFYNAWVITTGARLFEREKYQRQLKAEVVILETSISDCLKNIQNDKSRAKKMNLYKPIIEKWWQQYQRGKDDIVIK